MFHFIWIELLYRPLLNILVLLHNLFGGNIGLAIISLTILIRLVLLPSSLKAARSQKMLADLAPQLAELKKKHSADKERLARAQVELYQKNKISPISGCLIFLIQLPIMIALYTVFRDGLNLSRLDSLYSFISRPEVINKMFLGIDLSLPDVSTPLSQLGSQYLVLPILAGLLQFILSKISTPKRITERVSTEQIAAQQMLFIFPLMTVFIALRLPAGLALYWVVTTVFGIGQQIFINKNKIGQNGGLETRKEVSNG